MIPDFKSILRFCFLLFLILFAPISTYITGTNIRVIKVENVNPPTTATPIGAHISEPSPVAITNGIIANTVVRVVISTGRNRDLPAITTEVTMLRPLAFIRLV